ncbi:hypothetical protein Golob_016845, partial [Gossypium lobatum]|nr:hypothetical protein [Gossypium lobatum]MBA0685816.1 hypothetical protein [Gossypium aridum]
RFCDKAKTPVEFAFVSSEKELPLSR